MPVPVLDASALLAYMREEPGFERVRDAIAEGAAISIINIVETLSTEAAAGVDPAELMAELRKAGILGGAVRVHGVSDEDAIQAARLRPVTRDAGLSLGDRACLALTKRLGGVALSADRPWREAKVEIAIELIR